MVLFLENGNLRDTHNVLRHFETGTDESFENKPI